MNRIKKFQSNNTTTVKWFMSINNEIVPQGFRYYYYFFHIIMLRKLSAVGVFIIL